MSRPKAPIARKAPESKPRKKQAVTKTSKSATRALIRRNAADSPLISLPSEIRERILKLLLGEKLIHIRYLDVEELRAFSEVRGIPWNKPSKGAFRNTICSALGPTGLAHEALGDQVCHKKCEIVEVQFPTLGSHGPLHAIPISEDRYQPMKDALTVLSVCRQLYEESNFILWSTNTFSFNHSPSFLKFILSLNPAQKRNMKKLHLVVNVGFALGSQWGQVLNTKYLSMLRGLGALQLGIEHHLWLTWHSRGPREDDKDAFNHLLEENGLENLRLLPLKQASVAISNNRSLPDVCPFRSFSFITDEWKAVCANELREKLLDPRGAELQQAADSERKAVCKVQMAARLKRRGENKLRVAIQQVQKYQMLVTIATKYAEKMKTIADKAVAATESASRKPSEAQLAGIMARALQAKARADKKKSNLRLWQDRRLVRQQALSGC